MVLAALACPNLPQAPILAIQRTVGPDGRPLSYLDRKVEVPKSVTNPEVQLSPAEGIGCLFTAVRGHGAYQAALFSKTFTATFDWACEAAFVLSRSHYPPPPPPPPPFPPPPPPPLKMLCSHIPSLSWKV